jgi:hypothetical protein
MGAGSKDGLARARIPRLRKDYEEKSGEQAPNACSPNQPTRLLASTFYPYSSCGYLPKPPLSERGFPVGPKTATQPKSTGVPTVAGATGGGVKNPQMSVAGGAAG